MRSFKKLTQELREPDTCFFFFLIHKMIWKREWSPSKIKTWVLNEQQREKQKENEILRERIRDLEDRIRTYNM